MKNITVSHKHTFTGEVDNTSVSIEKGCERILIENADVKVLRIITTKEDYLNIRIINSQVSDLIINHDVLNVNVNVEVIDSTLHSFRARNVRLDVKKSTLVNCLVSTNTKHVNFRAVDSNLSHVVFDGKMTMDIICTQFENCQIDHNSNNNVWFNNSQIKNMRYDNSSSKLHFINNTKYENLVVTNSTLQESQGLNYAQLAFSNFGERGRQIVAYERNNKTNEITYSCGCFLGNRQQLLRYIHSDKGYPIDKGTLNDLSRIQKIQSRMLALNMLDKMMDMNREHIATRNRYL